MFDEITISDKKSTWNVGTAPYLLVVGARSSDPYSYLAITQLLCELLEGRDDASESRCNVGEVCDSSTDDEHLSSRDRGTKRVCLELEGVRQGQFSPGDALFASPEWRGYTLGRTHLGLANRAPGYLTLPFSSLTRVIRLRIVLA